MRRFRSLISAFGVGLLWAGAGAVAAVCVHGYLAPPSNQQSSEHFKSVGDIIPGIARWAQSAYSGDATAENSRAVVEAAPSETVNVAQPRNSDVELRAAQMRVAQQQADLQAQRVLTRSIQQELQRVGCYTGTVDGNWSEGTRVAMSAFNDSVRVKLPLSSPDYILLTMLQGHANSACKRESDPSIMASRAPVKLRRDAVATTASEPWTTVVTAPAKAGAKAVAPPAVSAAPAPASTSQIVVTSSERTPPDRTAGGPSRTISMAAPAMPLEGRMAVGAPLARPEGPAMGALAQPQPSTELTARDALTAVRPPQAVPAPRPVQRVSEPVRLSAPSPRRQESSGSSGRSTSSGGGRSPFSNLSSNAP